MQDATHRMAEKNHLNKTRLFSIRPGVLIPAPRIEYVST